MARPPKPPDLTKGESLTIRLRPKIKYFLELLSRKQHRSISDVIETMAIQASMESFTLNMTIGGQKEKVHLFQALWAPTEAERLVNLVDLLPELMTYDDDLRWMVIRDNGRLCRRFSAVEHDGITMPDGEIPSGWVAMGRPVPAGDKVYCDVLNLELIKKAWPDIIRAAKDEISEQQLNEALSELMPPAPAFTLTASGN